ncbi:hypothetical protein O0L34_g9529 [Tuta absoluta]|nr:hypothetical protein O0L34_g9529 [Tuta absoluta]
MLSLESVSVLALCIAAAMSAPNPSEDGKWDPSKYGNAGKYRRPADEGKYIHIPNPYIHIDNPALPYVHDDEPYVPAASIYRYTRVPPEQDNPFYKPGYYQNNGIKILHQNHNYEEDKYDFQFKTENKIRAEEDAITQRDGTAAKGFYEYIGPDGFMYRVDYTADERGFQPKMRRIETPYSGKWVLEKIQGY